jgi:tetratricopeptide (TPR) repeat protein
VSAWPWRRPARLADRPASTDVPPASNDGPMATPSSAQSASLRLLSGPSARIISLEPWLAPTCAAILLLAPNPLIWPATIIGVLPLAARLVTTGRPWRATPFDVPLLLLAIGSLLGGWASLSMDGAFIRLVGLVAALLLFAAAREHLVTARRLSVLVPGLLVASVVASLALLVLVGPFLLLDHIPPLGTLVRTADRWGVGPWLVDQDWLLQRYRFRASGVGALGVIGLALVFAVYVGRGDRRSRYLALVSIPLFLILLVVADNRGAILAAALTLGAMATVWRRRLLPLVPVACLLALLVVAFGPTDRGLSLKTLAQRFWFWENSLQLAREVPLTGAGLGIESVQLVYRAYFLPAYPPFSHAHNIYLQGLLEYGVVGLLGLLGLASATLYVGWTAPDARTRWSAAGRLAGFGLAAALLTTGLSEIVMLTTIGTAIALGALGLLAASTDASTDGPATDTPVRATVRSALPLERRRIVLLGGLAACAFGVILIVVTPLGGRIAARSLLSIGTADLNRGSLSESIDKQGREAALARAIGSLQRAAAFDPDDPTIQRNLALALAAAGESRAGRNAADRAKALTDPADRPGQFQLGRAYTAVNQWGDAIRAYRSAQAPDQLLQLGNRLLRLRNYDQAAAAFTATAWTDPTSRGAYDGLSRAVRARHGSAEDVIAALQPLMEASAPTEYSARLEAARVYREAGRLHDAGQQLVKAEQVRGGPDLSFEYGRVMLAAGRPDQAAILFRHPVADEPYEPEHWLWLARAQAQLGQHEQAVASIKAGLSRVDPSGQFAPPAEKLPETAAVRAVEIKRSERAPLLGTMSESLIRLGRGGPSHRRGRRCHAPRRLAGIAP